MFILELFAVFFTDVVCFRYSPATSLILDVSVSVCVCVCFAMSLKNIVFFGIYLFIIIIWLVTSSLAFCVFLS